MKYVLIAALAAVAAFLLAPLLLTTAPLRSRLGTGALDARFPLQTGAFQQPAAEDLRWHEKCGHAFSLKDRDESDPSEDPRWQRILAGRPKPRPFPGGCLDCHASNAATG